MALRYPVTTGTEFMELAVYSGLAAQAHYPNRFEEELGNGAQPWVSEIIQDANGNSLYHGRVQIIQTKQRVSGKGWNFVDTAQYGLITLQSSYPGGANLTVSNSRDFLKWFIYSLSGLTSYYGNVEHPIRFYSEGQAYRANRPIASSNQTQTANGAPVFIGECWLPLLASQQGNYAWLHTDQTVLPSSPAITLDTWFTSPN